MKKAGEDAALAVSRFGVAAILFGLSRIFWFSLPMLFLTAVFDSVSVIVHHTLIQRLTPDEMRGRISAVNNIFIGSSNEFGAVESGLTAALFGLIVSVVARGLGTSLLVIGVATIWPQTRKIGTLDKSIRATDMIAATSI
jgi:sugar phosphate permease